MSRHRSLRAFSATMACIALTCSSSLWAQSHSVAPGFEFYEILSDTFWSDVPFVGVPYGSGGTSDGEFIGDDLGTTAMVIQRNNSVTGVPGGPAQNANFEIISLQAVSAFPVEWNGGPLDSYFLTLQSDRNVGEGAGLASTGTHALTFGDYPEVDTNTGMHGTLRSFFTLALDIRQGALNGPIVDSGSVFFQTSVPNSPNEISWSHFPEGNFDDRSVNISDLNYLLDGSQDEDFFMEGPITQRLTPTLYSNSAPNSFLFQFVIENGAEIGGGSGGGASPSDPLLPNFGDDGFFAFDFEVGNNGLGTDQPIFIDPVYAVGYVYSISDPSSPLFRSVMIPAPLGGGDADFVLQVDDNYFNIVAGEEFFFTDLDDFSEGVESFSIHDIDLDEMLDPSNPMAFVTGLTFSTGGQVAMTMGAITVEVAVPEPSSLLMALAIPLAIGVLRRRS